jgi:hypothetical protein
MATQRDIERGLAQRRYGKSCYCCGKGPLSGHRLFLEPIGYKEVVDPARPLAPVCAGCRTALKEVPVLHHIENVRRDARKALAATGRWSDERGLDFAYIKKT